MEKLFGRATAEAVPNFRVMLARKALATMGKVELPECVNATVKRGAEAILKCHSEAHRSNVEAVMAEPKALLKELAEAVQYLTGRRLPTSRWEAMVKVQSLLELGRRFGRALSEMPERLKAGMGDT